MWQKIKSFIRNDDPRAKIKWSLYWRVWRECGMPYWKWLVAGVICTLIAASAEAYSGAFQNQIVQYTYFSVQRAYCRIKRYE